MVEKKMVLAAMAMHDGNFGKALESLGISRPSMHYLLRKYNLAYR